ncbi:MAG: HEAT repeat domain-containing protein [Sulfitobacter sp.]|nr:HEAT repeat domain-containing protein [Sulfitobacter sp.]
MNRSLWTLLGALLIAASLPACQSGAGAAKKPPVENRKRLGDLPESYSKLWKAWLLKDSRYPMLREAALADPDTTRFLVENLIGVVLGELSSGRVLSGPPGQPTSLERARLELVDLGAASTHALSEVLVLGSGLGPVAVEDLLVEIGGPSVDPLLAQLARKDSPVARRRASRTLGEIAFQRIPANMTTEVVRTALAECLENDEDWIVRSQSALALASWHTFGYGGLLTSHRAGPGGRGRWRAQGCAPGPGPTGRSAHHPSPGQSFGALHEWGAHGRDRARAEVLGSSFGGQKDPHPRPMARLVAGQSTGDSGFLQGGLGPLAGRH